MTVPPEMRVLEAEIGTLTLEAGDVLAVIFKERLTYRKADLIMSDLKRDLPKGVHVIIFTEDVKLAVVKPVLEDGPEYALAKREELMEISFDDEGVTISATMEGDQSNLTFDKLLEMVAELKRPKLYYAVSEFILPGEFCLVPAGDYHPEYFIIQPDDFARIKDELGLYRTLIPLADLSAGSDRDETDAE